MTELKLALYDMQQDVRQLRSLISLLSLSSVSVMLGSRPTFNLHLTALP